MTESRICRGQTYMLEQINSTPFREARNLDEIERAHGALLESVRPLGMVRSWPIKVLAAELCNAQVERLMREPPSEADLQLAALYGLDTIDPITAQEIRRNVENVGRTFDRWWGRRRG